MLLLTELFLLFLALGFLMAIVFYVIDRTQTRHSLRQTFPYWRAFVMRLRNWASFPAIFFAMIE